MRAPPESAVTSEAATLDPARMNCGALVAPPKTLLDVAGAPAKQTDDLSELTHMHSRTTQTEAESILLVDDDAVSLQILYEALKGRHYRLHVAKSGEQAFAVAARACPALMLLDIMMPGIDGYETLKRLKAEPATAKTAVIFLSALGEAKDKVRGLELGAVDYIAKPFDPDEVVARVETHLKIRRLERHLARKNRELEAANRAMRLDLEAATHVQESLLPKSAPFNARARFAWAYHPCQELGGDLLDLFAFDERYIGMYVVDVCGHGVPSSMLSVTISRSLDFTVAGTSVVIEPSDHPRGFNIVSPSQVARQLNGMFQMHTTAGFYFTMLYGVLDSNEGTFRFVSTGHPGPLVVEATGAATTHEVPGRPIGLWPESDYEEHLLELKPGDRLFLYSDGLSEERNPQGNQFGDLRLRAVAASAADRDLQGAVDGLVLEVNAWAGGSGMHDDVAIVAVEMIAL